MSALKNVIRLLRAGQTTIVFPKAGGRWTACCSRRSRASG